MPPSAMPLHAAMSPCHQPPDMALIEPSSPVAWPASPSTPPASGAPLSRSSLAYDDELFVRASSVLKKTGPVGDPVHSSLAAQRQMHATNLGKKKRVKKTRKNALRTRWR